MKVHVAIFNYKAGSWAVKSDIIGKIVKVRTGYAGNATSIPRPIAARLINLNDGR